MKLNFKWPEYDCDVNIDIANDGNIRFIIEQHKAISAFELDNEQADQLLQLLQTAKPIS